MGKHATSLNQFDAIYMATNELDGGLFIQKYSKSASAGCMLAELIKLR